MLDDFFVRALLAGIGVALVAGPLGCFIVWRQMAYFGDTLSHSALLGVALASLFDVNVTLAVFVVSALVSFCLLALQTRGTLGSDTILGLLSHSALAIGLVAIAFMTWIRIDLLGLLFGDVLAVSKSEIGLIYGGGAMVLALLFWIWRPLFVATVSRELAQAEGLDPVRYNIAFMILLAVVIAISMKIVGVLLITALLIIPAATARRFAGSPEIMAISAAVIGVIAVVTGLFASLEWNTPSGPSIVVAALALFIVSLTPMPSSRRKGHADE